MFQVSTRRTMMAALFAIGSTWCIPSATAQNHAGSYVVLELDVAALHRQRLEDIASEMAAALRQASPTIRTIGHEALDDHARVRLSTPADMERARRVLRPLASAPHVGADILTFTAIDADGVIEARPTQAHRARLTQQAADQTLEVIRRRLEPVGGVELARQGDLQIVVRAHGATDLDAILRHLGVTGQVTFHLVREIDPYEAEAGNIPPGAMLAHPYPGSDARAEIVDRRPSLTGERLTRANPSTDSQTGEFVLSFQFDSQGARQFCSLTRDHIGQRFAVLLDNQVLTAPRVNEPICKGSAQISGNFTAQSVRDLANLLRAGALPAPLRIVERGPAQQAD